MANSSEICLKWEKVFFAPNGEPVSGTLFLLTQHLDTPSLEWIVDSESIVGDPIFKIPLDVMTQVERRQRHVVQRCSTIYFRSRMTETFGPFEFTQGGTRDFIEKLGRYIDLQQTSSSPARYKVARKNPVYQLPGAAASNSPMNMIQGMGTKLVSLVDSLVLGATDLGSSQLFQPLATSFRPNERVGVGSNSPSPGDERFLDPEFAARRALMDKIYADRLHLMEPLISTDDGFQVVSHPPKALFIDIPDLMPVPRTHPLTLDEWQRHLDRDGRVTVVNKLQASIYNGGVDPEMRPVVWRYLFGYLKWDFTTDENDKLMEEKHHHYHVMRTFWKSMSSAQLKNCQVFRERRSIIKKDTVRTDRHIDVFRDDTHGNLTKLYNILITYTFYNLDLGYFQGMNDLLAVIMTEVSGEEDAFWCFVGLMNRLSGHFTDGPSSLSTQFALLFRLIEILMPRFAQFLREKEATSMNFCIKWFLIVFKREFSYSDVKVLWESIWSGCAPPNFQLLIAVAIFNAEAETIMQKCDDICQILMYVNKLSEHIALSRVLSQAQGIYNQLAQIQDHLPRELAIALGFSAPPITSRDRLTAEFDEEGDTSGLFDVVESMGGRFAQEAAPTNDFVHADEDIEYGCALTTLEENTERGGAL